MSGFLHSFLNLLMSNRHTEQLTANPAPERTEWDFMREWRKWSVAEMERNERGHDSPVFEAVSGLKLSSHLKCYPSSGRGRLTHTAHIKAPFLYTHTHIHTHWPINKPIKTTPIWPWVHYWETHIVSHQEHKASRTVLQSALSLSGHQLQLFYQNAVANHSFAPK